MNKSELKRQCVQNPLNMAEEIDRLARVCEEKDAEFAKLSHSHGVLAKHHCLVDGKLSEAQAQIAMQAEALQQPVNFDKQKAAFFATSETVAAWRAKETEPLRREVAMLRNAVNKYLYPHNLSPMPNRLESHTAIMKSMNDTQATALAYEREVNAKARVEFVKSLRAIPAIGLSERQLGELLRAANKVELK